MSKMDMALFLTAKQKCKADKTDEEAAVKVLPVAKKFCLVCGDRALGYNFNAITCESCKAFFRRNALKKKAYKCRGDGACEITTASRRFCQKCRLQKCLKIGMLPELIMTYQADVHGNQVKVMQDQTSRSSTEDTVGVCKKRKRLQSEDDCKPPAKMSMLADYSNQCTPRYFDDVTPPPPSVKPATLTPEMQMPAESDQMVCVPKAVLLQLIKMCHISNVGAYSKNIPNDASPPLKCICQCECGASSTCTSRSAGAVLVDKCIGTWSEDSEAGPFALDSKIEHKELVQQKNLWPYDVFRADEYELPKDTQQLSTCTDLALCDSNIMDSDGKLSDQEKMVYFVDFPPDLDAFKLFRIEELLSANEVVALPDKNSGSGPPLSFAESSMAVLMMDIGIRRTAEMLKRIAAFRNLHPADQVTLIKGTMSDLMLLRGIMVYDPSFLSFRPVGYPHRLLKVDVMTISEATKTAKRNFIHAFPERWRNCNPIMLCLTCLIFFDPERPGLLDRDSVRTQQSYYQNLLKCVLRSMYSKGESQTIFQNMLYAMEALRNEVPRIMPAITIELEPRSREPLLIDMFAAR